MASYRLGEAIRGPDLLSPDLLPCGYAVGRVGTLHVVLQPVAALAFEALIPRGVAQRLVSLLSEHRRLVLCGAPGKYFIALINNDFVNIIILFSSCNFQKVKFFIS